MARAFHEESLAIARELDDRQSVATSLNNLGLLAYQVKDYASVRTLHQESLTMCREIGDRWGIAAALLAMAAALALA